MITLPDTDPASIVSRYADIGANVAAFLVAAGVDLDTPFLSADEQRRLREPIPDEHTDPRHRTM